MWLLYLFVLVTRNVLDVLPYILGHLRCFQFLLKQQALHVTCPFGC